VSVINFYKITTFYFILETNFLFFNALSNNQNKSKTENCFILIQLILFKKAKMVAF